MRIPYYESTIHRQIREKRENRKERIRGDLELYGGEVLQSDEMKQAYDQTHHKWSTLGEHTMRVAMSSVMICYALRKLNIKVNIPLVVVTSLCHDLGMLDRGKFASLKESNVEHPKESGAPDSLEGAIVSVADKYNAVKDIVKGSEVKHTNAKSYVLDEKEKILEKVR